MFSLLFTGCNKEQDYKTQGELIGEELSREINENNITLCSTYYWNFNPDFGSEWKLGSSKVEFKIKDGYLVIGVIYYNLEQLYSWSHVVSGDKTVLNFYFK